MTDLTERLDAWLPPEVSDNVARYTVRSYHPNELKAELIDTHLRLIDATLESEHLPGELRCWVHDEVERIRALVKEAIA